MSTPDTAGSSDAPDRIEVSVPLRTEFFTTLRTVAASLGADAGFSVDEIDDLRLAISEVVTSLADARPRADERIDATFERRGAGLAVRLGTRHGETGIELDDLAASILASVVDEYDLGGSHVTLVKLASDTTTQPVGSHPGGATPNA